MSNESKETEDLGKKYARFFKGGGKATKQEELNDKQVEEEVNMDGATVCNEQAENDENHKHEESKEAKLKAKVKELKRQLSDAMDQCDNYLTTVQRIGAEFENYKRRTAKEKESVYVDATADVITEMLPVIDNFERALELLDQGNGEAGEHKPMKDGISLVYKQFNEIFKKLGVEEINCVDEMFNPEFHNAVMHIADPSYGKNVIVEVFQKGYTCKGKVIRHSMVKVAN